MGNIYSTAKGAKITDRRLNRVLEYMECEYMNPLTLDQLGKEAGVSRFHLVKLFTLPPPRETGE